MGKRESMPSAVPASMLVVWWSLVVHVCMAAGVPEPAAMCVHCQCAHMSFHIEMVGLQLVRKLLVFTDSRPIDAASQTAVVHMHYCSDLP